MATQPDEVRTSLTVVTTVAAAEVVASAEPAQSAEELRALLFVAAPILIGDYSDGTAALALEWYEELREVASPRRTFTPEPIRLVTDDYIRSVIAATTEALAGSTTETFPELKKTVLELVGASVPEIVADGFRDTMTTNAINDPASAGWLRFARPNACKFCKMLAAKGAVFTEKTARFAAHGAVVGGKRKGGDCMCIAGPEFGGKDKWAEATPMQYLASKRVRSAKEKARLREYLTENFPDAPG